MACERGEKLYDPLVSLVAGSGPAWRRGWRHPPACPRPGCSFHRVPRGPVPTRRVPGRSAILPGHGPAGCRRPKRNMSLPPCGPTGRRALEGTHMRFSSALVAVAVLARGTTGAPVVRAPPRAFLSLSPVPGADMVSCWNNVVIRQGSALDRTSLDARRLSVVGSASGAHTGRFQLATDGETTLFTPDKPYALGEMVHVRLAAGTRTLAGKALPELAYQFRVSRVDPKLMPRPLPELMTGVTTNDEWWRQPAVTAQTASGPCDTLLPGFPAIHLANVANAQGGVYFVAPFGGSLPAALEILA